MKDISRMGNHYQFMEAPYRAFVSPANRSNFLFKMEGNVLGNVTALNFEDEVWEHVLLEPLMVDRCPTWTEMVSLKEHFWESSDVIIQVHPTRKNYINIEPYTLHQWRHKKIKYDLATIAQTTRELLEKRPEKDRFCSFMTTANGRRLIAIYGAKRWPSWEEVCREKQRYFGEDCPAVQYNVSREFDLNNEFLLTVWDASNISLPPTSLV